MQTGFQPTNHDRTRHGQHQIDGEAELLDRPTRRIGL
jgi:hypothetical protein